MHSSVRMLVVALGALLVTAGFDEARDSITAEELRAHLYFLSHDLLEGRAPGTRGGRLAAEYIAAQFMGAGLEPVQGRYVQRVPLSGTTTDPTTAALTFERNDTQLRATYPSDAVIWPGAPHERVQVDAELVFVGYGIEAPAWRWDDYADRDLAGKVLLFLVGDPPAPPDEPGLFDGRALTYFGRWSYKLEEARRRGAAGALIIHTAEGAGYPWTVVESSWTGEQLMLADTAATGVQDGAPSAVSGEEGALLNGWLTQGFARDLLELGGLDLAELSVRASRRDFRPVSTGIIVRGRMDNRVRRLETRNVVGYLPGSRPAVRDQAVILTAHYDHLGIGSPVDGDSIFNGAYDNASGVGLLLEVADAFSRLDPTPDRGILFVATAAEEAGLLGALHYTRDPLIPLEQTTAVLNIDGANLWGETEDVVGLGADRSTLGEVLGPRAEELGLTVMPDPAPERGAFFRSDHFPFARMGIPVLSLQHGVRFRSRPAGWGAGVLGDYLENRYHQPTDNYDPAFNLEGAVQQGRLLFAVAWDVANAEEPPAWYDGEAPTVPSADR